MVLGGPHAARIRTCGVRVHRTHVPTWPVVNIGPASVASLRVPIKAGFEDAGWIVTPHTSRIALLPVPPLTSRVASANGRGLRLPPRGSR